MSRIKKITTTFSSSLGKKFLSLLIKEQTKGEISESILPIL